jgi:hypothetical protein
MYPESGGLSLVATPPKISRTGRHGVGWHAVMCYGAPEWFRSNSILSLLGVRFFGPKSDRILSRMEGRAAGIFMSQILYTYRQSRRRRRRKYGHRAGSGSIVKDARVIQLSIPSKAKAKIPDSGTRRRERHSARSWAIRVGSTSSHSRRTVS